MGNKQALISSTLQNMNTEYLEAYIILLSMSFLIGIAAIFIYKSLALKIGVYAEPNSRSSHTEITPTGGGIIISLIFIWSAIYFLFYIEKVPQDVFTIYVGMAMGGLAITIVGFVDDIIDTNAGIKLLIQIMLSIWIIFIFLENIEPIIKFLNASLYWPFIFLSLFFLVWLINVFNFMDAIDGIALSGTILIAVGAACLILFNNEGSSINSLLFLLLAIICLAFLIFNYPPASIFMGDAGSLFLGYIFCCMIIKTIFDGDLTIWTWIVLLGHFLTETTLTTMLRIKLTKNWYKAHRAMAYQNLARMYNSHKKVTNHSIIHYFIWLYPISCLTIIAEEYAIVLALISLLPSAYVTYKYGPLYSND